MEFWKSPKNRNFLKVFVKKLNFLSSLFFGQIKPQKNRFWKFWIKKNAFETRKRKFSKLLSYGNFQRG